MERMYEGMPLVATIDPQTVANSAKTSDVIDMSKYERAMAVFALGDMAAETIDCAIYTCDSAGSNGAAFKSASQLAAHASNNDNKQIVIEVDGDDLAEGGTNANRYIMARMVTGGSTGGAACCLVFAQPKQKTGDDDLASVAEVEIDKD